MTRKPKKVWKYFGAMFMEAKGPNGEQAVSFTRFLGVILFGLCLSVWTMNLFAGLDETGAYIVWDVPDGLLYTLWGLIGIKGAKDVAINIRR
jgi:hypothetical protein